MISEASHGILKNNLIIKKTIFVRVRFLGAHEFYLHQAEITKRLIQEEV